MKEFGVAVLAFLAAAVVPVAVLAAIWPLGEKHTPSAILISFLFFYPYSCIATILFGLPAFLVLRPFRPGHCWSVMIVGFLLGCLVPTAMTLPNYPELRDLAVDGPLGALAALVF